MNSSLATVNIPAKWDYGKRTAKIDRITPHCFVGQVTAKRGCEVFRDRPADRKASANYVIGKDGDIGVSVDEARASMCSSSQANDQRAVTIEIASDTVAPYAVTAAAWESLVILCADICKRNGKTSLVWIPDKAKALAYRPKSGEMLITVHRWFASKACPGDYIYNRLGELAESVTDILAAPPAPSGWAADAWAWARSVGLCDGTNPQSPATREQVVTMFSRFWKMMKG